MTTQYEQTVAALAEAAELEIEIGRDRVAEMVVEERIVLLKPSDEAESGLTAFSIVATAEDGHFQKSVLKEALSMNLFGSETGKGHLGLFGDSLFLSMDIDIEGITPEQLTERLLAFSRLADELEKQLAAEGGDGEEDDGYLSDAAIVDASEPSPGLGSLGDFMQV
mgnify:CR=1 FL=1